ncbi:MAG: hypothetical protein KAR42_08890 [candidate division Zixibacteria bacterium]|nr:hypothetical protein [candidate division Zixibacteria bacterium]
MSSQFIPSGRTSVIKRGEVTFQLQTEFANMPFPRVTTTIFSNGQVLHKINNEISSPVDSFERMHEVEDIIKAQHMDIYKTLRERGLPTAPKSKIGESEKKTRSEQIRDIEGVERVYLITPDGKLVGDKSTTKQFKKMFKHLFRELPDMLGVFAELPGQGREEGIYEVEPGRILLASTGVEFFLILLIADSSYHEIAPQVSAIIKS